MSKALIVTPDQRSRFSAQLLLESLGFEVISTASPGEALGHVLRIQPTLILLDDRAVVGELAGPVGILTAFPSAVRPCLIFTASIPNSLRIGEALEAGADDYLIGSYCRELLAFKLSQARAKGALRGTAPVITHLRKAG